MRQNVRGRKQSLSESHSATKSYTVQTQDAMLDCIAKTSQDAFTWCNFAMDHASAAASTTTTTTTTTSLTAVDDELMGNVQESFDATTSLTLACKKLAQELAKSEMSDQAASMVQQGVKLCKDLVEPTELVETILTSPRSELNGEDIIKTLSGAARSRLQ